MSDSEPAAGPAQIHLRPTASLAERVLLPGDPGRALALAQALLAKPRMFNHHRGLWGYTGDAGDGRPLTVQATGMGGPSAAIVLTELIALGARRAIRIGTCGALDPTLALGDVIVASEAICRDGTSRALGAGERIAPDAGLTEALIEGAPAARAGVIESVDVFYDSRPGRARAPAAGAQAIAVEMEAAALFAVGAGAGVPVACMLVVSDVFATDGSRRRIDEGELLGAAQRSAAVATAALAR